MEKAPAPQKPGVSPARLGDAELIGKGTGSSKVGRQALSLRRRGADDKGGGVPTNAAPPAV
jgi:hypothetical protein